MTEYFAAYQGPGWQPRRDGLRDEVRAGIRWSRCGTDSEYGALREVLIHVPSAATAAPTDPNSAQHLGRVDYAVLHRQMAALIDCYTQLGIAALLIDPRGDTGPRHNLVYARDLCFMTPEGAMIARMASEVRAGEEQHASAALAGRGIPLIRTIGGTGTFEGADALWLRPDLVAVAVGTRTDHAGYHQVRDGLAAQQVQTMSTPIGAGVQHLLGVLQLVDRDLAVVRPAKLPGSTLDRLRSLGIEIVELAETEEVNARQALNFVTVAPRSIVMASGCPETRRQLERARIDVVAELQVSELIRGGGGIACATGIVRRELVTDRTTGACDVR